MRDKFIYRSKAPFRLGLAGGGTDVSPYSDQYGGAILNATIDLFAYTTIEPLDNGYIIFYEEGEQIAEIISESQLPLIEDSTMLLRGVYNAIIRRFLPKQKLSFRLTLGKDVPTGSGLGTSSTIIVSMISAFSEWLHLPLGEYDMANLAYEIEREELKMTGGKQDQYAATFGGFNFMEFYEKKRVIVNPLRIRDEILQELAFNLVLFYTNKSRQSGNIISKQIENIKQNKGSSIKAIHEVKQDAFTMKEILLKNNLSEIGNILHKGWFHKKQMAEGISNAMINNIYDKVIAAGATGGKISGAGGGGFMFFFCPQNSRYQVIKVLAKFEGFVQQFQFYKKGVQSWKSLSN
ncbi:MAG: dehydrogenase [Chitinophagaceae bacterium]